MHFIFYSVCLYGFNSYVDNKVLLIARKSDCPLLDSVITHLNITNNDFTIIYTDKDTVLDKYIKKTYKRDCPLIFTDGIYRGSGSDYIMISDRRTIFKPWN